MGTSTLRFAIIVALAAVGVFAIANAFPDTGARRLSGGAVPTTSSPSPTQTQTEKPEKPEASPKVEGVKVAVFNTTDVNGLAALTGDRLVKRGYRQVQEPAQAAGPIAVTRIYYGSDRWKADAEYLAETLFKGAKVDALPPGQPDVAKGVQVAIYLGNDFASKQEK